MKYQMHCPKCNHEFTYDNGYYDTNIARLGVEIREIQLQLANHKLLPYDEQRRRTDWWLRAKRAVTEKSKELAELKALRKVYDQQRHNMEIGAFKRIVKELVGEEKYYHLLKKAEEEVKAYSIAKQMKHKYTRANSKADVTNINKL